LRGIERAFSTIGRKPGGGEKKEYKGNLGKGKSSSCQNLH